MFLFYFMFTITFIYYVNLKILFFPAILCPHANLFFKLPLSNGDKTLRYYTFHYSFLWNYTPVLIFLMNYTLQKNRRGSKSNAEECSTFDRGETILFRLKRFTFHLKN